MRSSTSRSAPALLVLAASLLAAVSACHDTAAPHRSVAVTVSVSPSAAPSFGTDSLGNPRITCYEDFTAASEGTGTAHWLDATYRFYYGKKRTTPAATFPMSASEIAQGWSSDSIVGGTGEHSTWYFSGGIPFSGEFEFHYTDGADTTTKSATARFTCGPDVSDSTSLPVIDTVTIVPPSGILPAGAPLTVTYQASSEAGIWETAVQTTGPCVNEQRFFERLQPSMSRELVVPMPAGCLHDVPIYLHVAVVDAAAQGLEYIIEPPLVIENRMPSGGPLLLPARLSDLLALGRDELGLSVTRQPYRFDDARPGRPRTAR